MDLTGGSVRQGDVYIAALYWAVATMLTVGYGKCAHTNTQIHVRPHSHTERNTHTYIQTYIYTQ
eukprot:39653-Eustigmatos_ZCMA.PRE.1